ncbi:MAG: type I-MYXAN CRISPR-associated protein Cas6/Cmx6 [Chromatiales bacterium]|jgi:CRISPR-associated protein Cas6|nr:type I-MYXAN CRISPR-associated protein Cas6/Cmx6 [Chromatiales bacterium]MDX9766213.1 type I-MYXAN CRISPR-associated protein Cas6/Cmx6 [Ectothiorhodospiraceae bacterium]
MYWSDAPRQAPALPDDVIDLAYRIVCDALPLDHAHALSSALLAELPWLADETLAGVHLIHIAESGNGWIRPEFSADEVLPVSRRTRLRLRLPRQRLEDAQALVGQVMDIQGHRMEVGEAKVQPLVPLSALFARHVAMPDETTAADEAAFLDWAAGELRRLGVPASRMMCGRGHLLQTPAGQVVTRSLMVADLEPPHALELQRRGIGERRLLGCGLFIGHKDIAAVQRSGDGT